MSRVEKKSIKFRNTFLLFFKYFYSNYSHARLWLPKVQRLENYFSVLFSLSNTYDWFGIYTRESITCFHMYTFNVVLPTLKSFCHLHTRLLGYFIATYRWRRYRCRWTTISWNTRLRGSLRCDMNSLRVENNQWKVCSRLMFIFASWEIPSPYRSTQVMKFCR